MRTLRYSLVVLLLTALALGGCSVFGKGGKGSGADSALTEEELNALREQRFGSGAIPMAEGSGMFRDINFDFDSAIIDDRSRQNIEYNAQVLQDNAQVYVQIEGHCDERGTAEYNLALGAQRARAVYDALVSYGIAPSRMETISYGEEVPLDPGHSESAWAKNRRVHLSPYSAAPAR